MNYRLEEEEELMQNVMYNFYKLYCAISMFMVLVEEHKSAMTIIINLLLLLLFLHGL